jgi:hypothetical protein
LRRRGAGSFWTGRKETSDRTTERQEKREEKKTKKGLAAPEGNIGDGRRGRDLPPHGPKRRGGQSSMLVIGSGGFEGARGHGEVGSFCDATQTLVVEGQAGELGWLVGQAEAGPWVVEVEESGQG